MTVAANLPLLSLLLLGAQLRAGQWWITRRLLGFQRETQSCVAYVPLWLRLGSREHRRRARLVAACRSWRQCARACGVCGRSYSTRSRSPTSKAPLPELRMGPGNARDGAQPCPPLVPTTVSEGRIMRYFTYPQGSRTRAFRVMPGHSVSGGAGIAHIRPIPATLLPVPSVFQHRLGSRPPLHNVNLTRLEGV